MRSISDTSTLIPLFWEGPAYAVFTEMPEADRKKSDKIEEKLKEAFGTNPFRAYEELMQCKWDGESVDVFLSRLRKLAKHAGVESDDLLRRAFVVGLPAYVSRELRSLPNIENAKIPSLLARARVLIDEHGVRGSMAAVLGKVPGSSVGGNPEMAL